jgi:hypothetical protein
MAHNDTANVPVERLPVLLHKHPETLVTECGILEHLLQRAVVGLGYHAYIRCGKCGKVKNGGKFFPKNCLIFLTKNLTLSAALHLIDVKNLKNQ